MADRAPPPALLKIKNIVNFREKNSLFEIYFGNKNLTVHETVWIENLHLNNCVNKISESAWCICQLICRNVVCVEILWSDV
jgi:hypothetical protein